jgi:hypothetical protein
MDLHLGSWIFSPLYIYLYKNNLTSSLDLDPSVLVILKRKMLDKRPTEHQLCNLKIPESMRSSERS